MRKKTDATTIGIGSGVGALSISDTELATMTASSFIFGGTNGTDGTSGNMDITTAHDFGDSNVTYRSGGDIDIGGALDKATGVGTASYVFEADNDVFTSNNSDITASSGALNITLNSDKMQLAAEQLTSPTQASPLMAVTSPQAGGANPLTTAAMVMLVGMKELR